MEPFEAAGGRGRKAVRVKSSRSMAEQGSFGTPKISRVALARRAAGGAGRERAISLFEKIYPAQMSHTGMPYDPRAWAQHNQRIFGALKKAGLKVPVTYRVMRRPKSEWSLLQTDLTFGGKRQVTSGNVFHCHILNPRLFYRITNLPEVLERMKSDVREAAKRGIALHGDEWVFSVDRQTGKADAYLADFNMTRRPGRIPDVSWRLEVLDKLKSGRYELKKVIDSDFSGKIFDKEDAEAPRQRK